MRRTSPPRSALSELAVQYRPISSLAPYGKNPRTHSEAQIDQIAGSIREYGWTNPVLVDGDCGVIAGHGRLLAAKRATSVEAARSVSSVVAGERYQRYFGLFAARVPRIRPIR